MKKLLLLIAIIYSVSAHSQAPQLLKDILPGNPISPSSSAYVGPRGLINYNNQFYFIAPDTVVQFGNFLVEKEYNLWKSDGTSAGTQKIKDLNPIGNDEYYYSNGSSIFQPLNSYDNQLFFSATDGTTFPILGTYESQLCTSDGTSSGTLLFENLRTGSSCSGVSYEPHDFIPIDKKLLFKTNCPCSDDPTFRFWEYDSITKTTQKLGEDYIYYTWAGSTFDQRFQPFDLKNNFMLFPQPNYIMNPAPGQTVHSSVPCFTAYNKQLGKLQKLKDSTHVVSIMEHINSSQIVVALIPNIFAPNFAVSLYSLNKNTLQLTPYYTFSTHSSTAPGIITNTGITYIGELNNKLYFMVNSPVPNEKGLWVTDGTNNGTYLIKSIPNEHSPQSTKFNNEIYFTSSLWINSVDTLWKTDGTSNGTVSMHSFCLGTLNLTNSEPFDNKLFFSADGTTNNATNKELWKTDGTPAGTQMYYDLFPGTQGSIPEDLLAFNNKLFFSAYTPASGREIFYIESISSIIAENNINDFSFNLFPNPSANYITIEINTQNVNGNLKIINNIGQLISTTNINSTNINVDVSTLNSGIYNLIIENNNHFATKKLQIIK